MKKHEAFAEHETYAHKHTQIDRSLSEGKCFAFTERASKRQHLTI